MLKTMKTIVNVTMKTNDPITVTRSYQTTKVDNSGISNSVDVNIVDRNIFRRNMSRYHPRFSLMSMRRVTIYN